jgi:hypothetical protein
MTHGLFDGGIFDPAIFDTHIRMFNRELIKLENTPRNTIWEPYVWRHGMWEKTMLRKNIEQVEKTVIL